MAEVGIPDLTLASWTCWAFPAGTPWPIISRLAEEIAAIKGSAAMRERAAGMGARMLASNPAAVQARLDREREKWREMVRISGAKLE